MPEHAWEYLLLVLIIDDLDVKRRHCLQCVYKLGRKPETFRISFRSFFSAVLACESLFFIQDSFQILTILQVCYFNPQLSSKVRLHTWGALPLAARCCAGRLRAQKDKFTGAKRSAQGTLGLSCRCPCAGHALDLSMCLSGSYWVPDIRVRAFPHPLCHFRLTTSALSPSSKNTRFLAGKHFQYMYPGKQYFF